MPPTAPSGAAPRFRRPLCAKGSWSATTTSATSTTSTPCSWTLEPHGDQVRVTYEARVAAPFAVPGWVARLALRHDVPMALLALRREAMARAQTPGTQ